MISRGLRPDRSSRPRPGSKPASWNGRKNARKFQPRRDRLRPWLRRLITRLIAIIPAVIVTALYGEKGTTDLLVFSQVILSLQLTFAVVPLVIFTSDRRKMGEFVNPAWLKFLAWSVAIIIAALNAKLLFDQCRQWFG